MPRKLCYICEATQGGVRTHLDYLVKHFARKDSGYEVTVLAGDRGELGFTTGIDKYWKPLGVSARILKDFTRNPSLLKDHAVYGQLKKILRELKPDIVHTHSSKAGFLGRAAAWGLSVPKIIHTPHVFSFQWARGISGAVYARMERWAARRCHHLICVAEAQREMALQHGLTQPKLEVIPNGVALANQDESARASVRAQHGWTDQHFVIGAVTRMAPQKDNRTLLRAAQLLIQRAPNVRLAILGGGNQDAEVRALAASYGLKAPSVEFFGYQENVAEWYAGFDALAFSSLYEGMPYVILEACAHGLPVVASDVMGVREIIQKNKSGLLVSSGQPNELAEAMTQLVQNPELRKQLGQQARERIAAGYSLDEFLRKHEAVYSGSP